MPTRPKKKFPPSTKPGKAKAKKSATPQQQPSTSADPPTEAGLQGSIPPDSPSSAQDQLVEAASKLHIDPLDTIGSQLQSPSDVNWGSSTQAHTYKNALESMLKLQKTVEHVKTFRPQVLVLTGNPVARPSLIDFVSSITTDSSLMLCGQVILFDKTSDRPRVSLHKLSRQTEEWMDRKDIKGFYSPVVAPTFAAGVDSLLQLSGLGKLRPNIVMVGYKNNWRHCSMFQINDYVNVIHAAFDMNFAVGIFRVKLGFDCTELLKQHNIEDFQRLELPQSEGIMRKSESYLKLSPESDDEGEPEGPADSDQNSVASEPTMERSDFASEPKPKGVARIAEDMKEKVGELVQILNPSPEPAEVTITPKRDDKPSSADLAAEERAEKEKNLVAIINRFQTPVKEGVIDVYWLADDGGLTLLIPYLLTLSPSYLDGAKLRVFTIASSKSLLEQEHRSIATLLSKFRINYSDVFVVPDITQKPRAESTKVFEDIIKDFRVEHEDEAAQEGYITEAELLAQKNKTNRQIRARELLLEHSVDSSLVVMTLPVPRKGSCSSALYMAWLEVLTKDIGPPILLVRGNQTSVLTFYS